MSSRDKVQDGWQIQQPQPKTSAPKDQNGRRAGGRRNYIQENRYENEEQGENQRQIKSNKTEQNTTVQLDKQKVQAKQTAYCQRNVPRSVKQPEEKKKTESSSSCQWDEQPSEKDKKKKIPEGKPEKVEEPKKDEKVQKAQDGEEKKKLDQSCWILKDLEEEEKPKERPGRGGRGNGRGQAFHSETPKEKQSDAPNIIENKHDALSYTILQKQIEADEKNEINTSWVASQAVDTQPKTQVTRGNRRTEANQEHENEGPVRGNRRGNRQGPSNQDYQRGDGFKKKNQYEDGNRGGYYNNNYNGYGRGGRGGRGRDNYRQRQYGQGPNRDYRQKGEQSNNYRNYNNRDDRKDTYEHVNRNYEKRSNYNRSQNDYRREGRDYENNNYNYAIENQRKARLAYESSNQKIEEKVVPKKEEEPSQVKTEMKSMKILPRGQKCWPEMSMYIMEAKLSFSYRQITEHECDILIIPYKDLKFEMYPGNIINKCKADYRKKIAEKGSEIEEVGFIYPQKCVGIQNFKAIGFLKMGRGQTEIRQCIAGILPKLKLLKMTVSTILIPYSKDMGPAKEFIQIIIESLSKFDCFKEVNISTNNAADFKAGVRAFTEEVEGYMDENKICIDY